MRTCWFDDVCDAFILNHPPEYHSNNLSAVSLNGTNNNVCNDGIANANTTADVYNNNNNTATATATATATVTETETKTQAQKTPFTAQIVVLGAGYDTRFFRLAITENIKCFEIDTDATQIKKINMLKRSRIISRHYQYSSESANTHGTRVTFVSCNFESEDWFVNLCDNGFNPDLPTLFLWEGVMYY